MAYDSSWKLLQGELEKCFSTGTIETAVDLFGTFCNSQSWASSDLGVDLEIAFRSFANDKIILSITDEVSSPILRLLKFSIGFSLKCTSLAPNSIPKIPFLLIEDILEGQTIANAEVIWKLIEATTEDLTHPDLFVKGRLIILRVCNSLLRKLSKSCNTEFSGRILMFLAAIYPISERSAVNLPGRVNTTNLTAYANYDQYRQLLSAEKSKLFGDDTVGVDGDDNKMDIIKKEEEEGEELPESANVASDENYEKYQSFWKLQEFMISELKRQDSDFGITSSDTATSAADSPVRSWETFKLHVDSILDLFSSNPFSDTDLTQGQAQMAKRIQEGIEYHRSCFTSHDTDSVQGENEEDDAVHDRVEYMSLKYLTSPQLFALQKHDPQVRQEILIQLLIYCHNLRLRLRVAISSAASAETQANSAVSTALEQAAAKLSSIRGKARPASEASNLQTAQANSALKAATATVVRITAMIKDARVIRKRALALLAATPPNGADVVACLNKLLALEKKWMTWKQNACPAYELASLDMKSLATSGPSVSSESLVGKKRNSSFSNSAKNLAELSGRRASRGGGVRGNSYLCDLTAQCVADTSKFLVACVPTFEQHIVPYVEAEDPDAGIEEEYHPKHDGVHCWRARRLLAASKLAVFEHMGDGDLSKALKRIAEDASKKRKGDATIWVDSSSSGEVGAVIETETVGFKLTEDSLADLDVPSIDSATADMDSSAMTE